MLDKAKLIRRLAENYTAAWCSQDPVRVASFYEEKGSLRVNDEVWQIGTEGLIANSRGHFDSLEYRRQLEAS